MAAPSVTYSFSAGTTIASGEVNTNFGDIIAGITDGTKDLTINALTCNGATTLGNATGDDVTINGYVASSVLPKTAGTYDLGSSSQAWRSLYLDRGATDSGAIYFDLGTTEYIKGNAAGTQLEIGGFTSLEGSGLVNRVAGWVRYDQSGPAITDSYNVTSVSDDATGKFTVTWDTNMGDANYPCVATAGSTGGVNQYFAWVRTYAAGTTEVWTSSHAGTNGDLDQTAVVAIGATA